MPRASGRMLGSGSTMEGEHPKSSPSRITNHASRYQRALGQYFTPEHVVELCYRMLRTLDPDAANPSIIDPACGEGAFLSYALEHGITTPDRLFGVEKDPAVADTITSSGMNLFIGDGLSEAGSLAPCGRSDGDKPPGYRTIGFTFCDRTADSCHPPCS